MFGSNSENYRYYLLQLLFSRKKKMFGSNNSGLMSYSVGTQKPPATLFLQDFGGALLQDGQVGQDRHHLGFKRENFYTKFCIENADFLI